MTPFILNLYKKSHNDVNKVSFDEKCSKLYIYILTLNIGLNKIIRIKYFQIRQNIPHFYKNMCYFIEIS